jgi:hypothetical protein
VNEPRDDLPPSVYWRRRTLAVVGTSVAVLLFIWAVGALLGGNSSRQTNNAADEGSVPIATTTPSAPSSIPPPISAVARGSSTTSPSSTTPVAPTTTSAPGSPAPPPPPPGPPQPCPDASIALTATTDRPSYPVGRRPVFTLHIRNTGTVACTRDVSRPVRDLVVVPAGSTAPLWSDTDCYAVPSHDIPTLAPGQEITYTVTWAGRTSAPGCPAHRTTVGAGQYALIAKLGPLSSAPAPFTLTPQ